MPTYHDFIYDNANDKPTYTPFSTAGVIMEFHGLPDPGSNDAPPEMRIEFRNSQFAGKYKDMPNTTVPTLHGSWLRFTGTPGTVRGEPCTEVRIMLDPAVAQDPEGYPYLVKMRRQGGVWKTWDPRVIPK